MIKRLKTLLAVLACLALLSTPAWAAGSATISTDAPSERLHVMVISWTGDASDGTVPDLAITMANWRSFLKGYWLYLAVTNPGATAPTTLYDLTVVQDGRDLFSGGLADRSATATEAKSPIIDDVTELEGMVPITGDLTVTWANQAVHSATGTLTLFFVRL